jgi:hypothetical protein
MYVFCILYALFFGSTESTVLTLWLMLFLCQEDALNLARMKM